MRRRFALEFVSLDGVIQSPGLRDEDPSSGFAHVGRVRPYADPLLSAVIATQMNLPFELLLGRVTFDSWAAYWPHHAAVWPGVQTATKYVASNTMTAHAWQPSVFLGGDVAERVAEIKLRPGPDLHVYGSANLVQTLMQHDLVDAFWLKIYPITLGGGKRLFAEGTAPAAFGVSEREITPSGVVAANYERAGAVAIGG